MNNPIERPTEPDPAADVVPRADASRRRLLQGGLGAAPVLMTLFSRPVLGQTACVTESAFLSGNASSPGEEFLPVCPTVDPTMADPNPNAIVNPIPRDPNLPYDPNLP